MFEFDYECPNGHPVLPGGQFCMHCGSRVASGAAARTERAQTVAQSVQTVPDGYAMVPEGYKLVPLPEKVDAATPAAQVAAKPEVKTAKPVATAEPMAPGSLLAQFLTAALAPIDLADEAEATSASVELVENPVTSAIELVEKPAAVVAEEKPVEVPAVDVADMDGAQIDDALASWLNDNQDGWRMPEYEIPESVKSSLATKPEPKRECAPTIGHSSIGFTMFPFPGISIMSVGGTTAGGTRVRRGGLGFFALPMIMFFLLSMFGSLFSGPNSNVVVVPGGVMYSNSTTVGGTGTGAGTGTVNGQ